MEFNKIKRGNKREHNFESAVYDILDAGFICDIGFQAQGQTMIIPTAYGRKDDYIYIHGSTKNFMLNEICNGQTCCVCVTHLDGIVLAKTLFNTSANYRSVVLFGKAEKIINEAERIEGLKIITDQIIADRWGEVPIGSDNEVKATLVVKIKIESASAKIREGGPNGDENEHTEAWSGHIPMQLIAKEPIIDNKFNKTYSINKSVEKFLKKFNL